MKILVLTNYYPPYYVGGYELRCRSIVEEWKKNGHEIKILTTRFGLRSNTNEASEDILRWLDFEPRPFRRWGTEGLLQTYQLKERVRSILTQEFCPDVVNVWNMLNFPKFVLWQVMSSSIPMVYHIEDASWLYTDFNYELDCQGWKYKNLASDPVLRLWKKDSNHALRLLIKRIMRSFFCLGIQDSPILKISYATFVSQYRMQEYLEKGDDNIHAEVVPGGIDIQKFSNRERKKSDLPIKLLYVGQIYRQKGLHTIIEGLSLLGKSHEKKFELSVVGVAPIQEEAYLRELQYISQYEYKFQVRFFGKVKHDDLPSIYREHDVLVFPSIIPEGFALTPLEAMANGMIVLSTATGGNAELVKNEVNAAVFKEDNPQDLARLLKDLASNPKKYEELAVYARNHVSENFTIDRMAARMMSFFKNKVVSAS